MLNFKIVSASLAVVGSFLLATPASAQFRRNAGNDVILFADVNFQGASVRLGGDTADLRRVGLNDKVSSIEIPRGETWQICQDVNYRSNCQTVTGSVPDLRTIGWNDRISSMRRVDGRFLNGQTRDGRRNDGVFQQSQSLVFYARPGYRGATTVVTSDAYNQGVRDGRMGSVEVRSGTWQLCDRTGRCSTINQSVPDLSRLGLNGQITSVRLVNNFQNDGRRRDPNYGDRRY